MILENKNVGIAILSTDRHQTLKRLVDSIEQFSKISSEFQIYVIDDSKEKNLTAIKNVCNKDWINLKHTGERIGVAKNTNFALETLEPFPYKLILNNDVEILKPGWQFMYPFAIIKTGYHCFCHRQLGLWGACKEGEDEKRPDKRSIVNGIPLATIQQKPHGAVIAFDKKMHNTVGYYDSDVFRGYGMSHHFWTVLAGISGIQPYGFHDVAFSNDYFYVHNEKSVTPQTQRILDYRRNQELYNEEVEKVKDGKRAIYTPFKR